VEVLLFAEITNGFLRRLPGGGDLAVGETEGFGAVKNRRRLN
jgi:hypothetical protein